MSDDGQGQVIRNIFRKVSDNIRSSIPDKISGVIVLQENDRTQDHEPFTSDIRIPRDVILNTDDILSDNFTNLFINEIVSVLERRDMKLLEFIKVEPLDRTGLGIYNLVIIGKFDS